MPWLPEPVSALVSPNYTYIPLTLAYPKIFWFFKYQYKYHLPKPSSVWSTRCLAHVPHNVNLLLSSEEIDAPMS